MSKLSNISAACGIISSIIYIATDIITGLHTPGYSFNNQTVSELSAIGAPTRIYWQILTFIYNPLLIYFGLAVRNLGENQTNRSLKYSGLLITFWGVLGFIWLLFPMNSRGNIGSNTDTMHLVMTGITVLLMVLLIAIGSGIASRFFRIYSFTTLLVMMFFGVITGQQTSHVASGLPTPWMGVTERITSYAPLFWIVVLALVTTSNHKKN